ncbi:hypothetical protein AMECASPLE_008421 [Ameca splendens]|uniref:Secreted protein n=1 Tax=Ameca splendens TaxID=208324 RepID=A0ABV0YMM1_9TELE
MVWSETFTSVARWRSLCRALAVLILFLLKQSSTYRSCRWVKDLRPPCPAVSWNLLHALETLLGGIANLQAMAYIDVPSWGIQTACATSVGSRYRFMLPVVTLTVVKCRTTKKRSKK